jgi:hypothetical protein
MSEASYRAVVLADAPWGYWALAEASGSTAADASGNGHTLTHNGSPTLNQAAWLDARSVLYPSGPGNSSTYSVTSASFSTPTNWSAEAICYFASTRTNQVEIGTFFDPSANSYGNWFVNTDGSLNIAGFSGGTFSGSTSAGVVPSDQWVHLVFTHDGTNLRAYVNGALVLTVACGVLTSSTKVWRWRYWTNSSTKDAFYLSDCALWLSTTLSATQIALHYSVFSTPPLAIIGSGARARGASATIVAPFVLHGTSARARGASATEAISDHLNATAARARGASASMQVAVDLDVLGGAGWEFNGRVRDASATITVDAPVAPPPADHELIKTAWLTIPAGPTLDSNGQPDSAEWRASATEHHGVWGRYRIVVAGVDVSFFRGAETIVLSESDTEPFGDDVLTVQFPMISPFEELGVGAIAWLPGTDDDKHTPVTVQKVDELGAQTVRWEGSCDVIVDGYDGQTGALQVSFLGLVKTLDQRITKPRFTSDPIDIGQLIHDLIAYEVKYGWAGHAPASVATGTQTAERGGYGDPLATVTIQNLLAEDGDHTLTNLRPRGMKIIAKDRTTVHFTLWCGQSGVTQNLQRNLEHAVAAIFGEGMDAGTQFWRNTQYPNAPISPPAYPLPSGQFFNPGDSHTGFQPFSDELRTRGYHLKSQDKYLAVDEPIIRDFQDDVAISVDGVVGGQTWNKAFAIGLSAHALDAYIRPLAVVSAAEPFLYNSRGGIIGKNPGYTGRTRRERKEDFGTLPKASAKTSAKDELVVIRSADYFGTVTAENIDPPEMCALDTRAGMNLLFKGHRGVDRLLHVAGVQRNPGMVAGQPRTVTWTASERGDDFVTIAARMQRQRDVVDQSGRTRAPRRGAKISPDFAPWDSEAGAGYLSPRAQTAGLWNVYPIPAGERGTIAHVRLVASVPCLISAAVFNARISENHLANLPGLRDPSSGAAGGLDPWQVNAEVLTRLLTYADQPWMAWATGGPGAMQGYWPNTPDVGATVTGVLDDAASFTFHSAHGVWLFLAVWTSENCTISGDPAYDHRALFPGADA